ncbi:MAG: hypothetical protein KatS3mg076_0996 [Candidatus Binatia bacterium]|nr:MAG: hypothetical protein KatS3mg076_0996 [Candidatus Binatia bacterium]
MKGEAVGFTIVEILVAMAILLVAFLALATLHVSALRATSLARKQTLATILAYERVERFQRLGLGAVEPGSETTTIDGQEFSRSWSVSGTPGESRLVVVNVAWSDPWGTHAIELPAVVRP